MFYAKPAVMPCPAPLKLGSARWRFDDQRYVMGVVNVTPDSFSDGGLYESHEAAITHALALMDQGAHVIDVGGESTRPGAQAVELGQELERVIPVIEGILARRPEAILSIDTTKAEVTHQALKAGALIANDISGLGFEPELAAAVAQHDAALVLMHIKGTPRTMQAKPHYEDLIDEVTRYLQERVALAQRFGVSEDQVIVDPGLGFGKSVAHNYTLIRELGQIAALGRPILLGPSRKSFIGAITGKPAQQRRWGTAATVACGIFAGAHIVRVHDVEEMAEVVQVAQAVCQQGA